MIESTSGAGKSTVISSLSEMGYRSVNDFGEQHCLVARVYLCTGGFTSAFVGSIVIFANMGETYNIVRFLAWMVLKNPRLALKKHLVDSTSMLAEASPLFALLELGIGLSPDSSRNARILASVLTYGGLGWAYARGRDVSQRLFRISDATSERVRITHDVLYTASFNLTLSPPMYVASQLFAGEEIDLSRVVVASLSAVVFGGMNGPMIGYAVDAGRDLVGIEVSRRPSYLSLVTTQNSRVKKCLFAGMIGASIGLMAVAYSCASHHGNSTPNASSGLEQIVE